MQDIKETNELKKLLMLGGANSQIPAIMRAKELGYYVITCDYLPNNPGHKFSDEYKNISTVEKEKVLEFAQDIQIEGIIAYASDPSAKTAAYVSDHLGLVGSPYKVVKMLCEKDLFRKFQKDNGFATPLFFSISNVNDLRKIKETMKLPCVVKPVDSAGSKGVTIVKNKSELEEAFFVAEKFTRCGRVIVEEYICTPYAQLHGDGVIHNGKVQFLALGDQRFKNSVPIGSSLPSRMEEGLLRKTEKEVERLIDCSGFANGGINVEARVTESGDIYILEIGPRTGGNYVPQLMQLATGEDEMTAVLQIAMNSNYKINLPQNFQYCFQYIIGSQKAGTFQEIYIDQYMEKKVVDLFVHKKKGDQIKEYENSNGVVGVALIKFECVQEMEQDISNIRQHIQVVVEEDKK